MGLILVYCWVRSICDLGMKREEFLGLFVAYLVPREQRNPLARNEFVNIFDPWLIFPCWLVVLKPQCTSELKRVHIKVYMWQDIAKEEAWLNKAEGFLSTHISINTPRILVHSKVRFPALNLHQSLICVHYTVSAHPISFLYRSIFA